MARQEGTRQKVSDPAVDSRAKQFEYFARRTGMQDQYMNARVNYVRDGFDAGWQAGREELTPLIREAEELFDLIAKFAGGDLTRVKLWRARVAALTGEKP
jgi:hypothetical protein